MIVQTKSSLSQIRGQMAADVYDLRDPLVIEVDSKSVNGSLFQQVIKYLLCNTSQSLQTVDVSRADFPDRLVAGYADLACLPSRRANR